MLLSLLKVYVDEHGGPAAGQPAHRPVSGPTGMPSSSSSSSGPVRSQVADVGRAGGLDPELREAAEEPGKAASTTDGMPSASATATSVTAG